MELRIRKDTVQLRDSWDISKKDFDTVLDLVHIEDYIPNRTRKSLKREWAVHNFFYNLGIKRDKTGHVDFDFKEKWYEKLGYGILGRFVWILIK